MIPVHENVAGANAPAETHYVLASNGVFLHQRQWWVDGVVRVPRPPVWLRHRRKLQRLQPLLPEEPFANLLLPKLPALILGQAHAFAQAVCDLTKSEVCLLLFYEKDMGYTLRIPKQIVSPGSIDYDPMLLTAGSASSQCVGSIHSHGLLDAYHSNVDEADEAMGNDGVHVTLGKLGSYPDFSLSAEMAISGSRFPVEDAWFEGLSKTGSLCQVHCEALFEWEIPDEWFKQLTYGENEDDAHDPNWGAR